MKEMGMTRAFTRFKAVIFDLDGVITDTARFHYLAWKRLAGRRRRSASTKPSTSSSRAWTAWDRWS